MEIILSEEQQKAINSSIDFINSDKTEFLISGYAGTGKTLLIKEIIKYLEKRGIHYTLCAPTHRAKVVLEKFTAREGITIHKLLSLSPMIEIMHLDFNNLKFIQNNGFQFPRNAIIICDEASMINNDLFDLLSDRAKKNNCKIIFIGDIAQLKPVNANSHSKVFNLKNSFYLTKVFRQKDSCGYSNYLLTLRESIIPEFKENIEINGSLYCTNDIKTFIEYSIPYFHKAIKNNDILEIKILAYTNARVEAYNKKIKSIFFKDGEYNKGEIITGYENLEFNRVKFWNSMDYIVMDTPIKKDVFIPGFIKLPGYYLNLYNSSNKELEEVFILSSEISKDYFESLAYYIESTRLTAVESKINKSKEASKNWKNYYELIGSFTSPIDLYYSNRLIRKKSFGYGYSTTVHKSQGGSINNVFIDMKNILLCKDREELRQLQYVAMSRTMNNIYLFQ